FRSLVRLRLHAVLTTAEIEVGGTTASHRQKVSNGSNSARRSSHCRHRPQRLLSANAPVSHRPICDVREGLTTATNGRTHLRSIPDVRSQLSVVGPARIGQVLS